MAYMISRSTSSIDDLRNFAAEGMDSGSRYPGMSFEEGIAQTLSWLFGETDENPAG